VQPGEGEMGLGPDPAAGQRPHLALSGQPLSLREQRGLADARLAAQQQGSTGASRRLVEHCGQGGDFALTADRRGLTGSDYRYSRPRATHSA